jgi:hypothetical protein
MVLATACGFEAMPTDEAGSGRTEELEEALSRHDLRLPADASDVTYTVHTSIDSHAVGVRFRTTSSGLDEFLTSFGHSLKRDLNPWDVIPWEVSTRLSSESPERYGWDLANITNYAGREIQSESSLGTTGVLVDSDEPDAPVVYAEVLDCC